MESSELDLRYTDALFLVLSGVLCELEQSHGSHSSEFEVPQYHQAEGCCIGCDGTLSPLEDLPTYSWMLWHSAGCVGSRTAASKVQDGA